MTQSEIESMKEEYIKLKKMRRQAVDEFEFIRLLAVRLMVFVNATESELYDLEDLMSNIISTADDLYNFCIDFKLMLQEYN